MKKSTNIGLTILALWRNKGLKVAEAVYNTKGERKFEKNKEKMKAREELSFNQLSARKAYERMSQERNVSSYAASFGKEAEADHDSSILTFKKMKDLACAQVLNSNAYAYFDKWLSTARETYYKDLLMRILKSIYVYSQSKEPPKSLHRNTFAWTTPDENSKPPRIDKLKVRKFNLPTEEEIRYIKFPELKGLKPNPQLEDYKQKFDVIRQEAKILSSDIRHRTFIRTQLNDPAKIANISTDLTISKKMKSKLLQGTDNISNNYKGEGSFATQYGQSYKGATLKYETKRAIDDFNKSSLL